MNTLSGGELYEIYEADGDIWRIASGFPLIFDGVIKTVDEGRLVDAIQGAWPGGNIIVPLSSRIMFA